MVLTFPGYEKVLCKEAAAYLSGRATTGYSYLEVATAGTTGNQLVQPFGSATANNDHYTVTFPEGYFELDDDVVNPAFNVTFAVYKETSSTDGVSYSTTPLTVKPFNHATKSKSHSTTTPMQHPLGTVKLLLLKKVATQ
jgi:hypothetical protein